MERQKYQQQEELFQKIYSQNITQLNGCLLDSIFYIQKLDNQDKINLMIFQNLIVKYEIQVISGQKTVYTKDPSILQLDSTVTFELITTYQKINNQKKLYGIIFSKQGKSLIVYTDQQLLQDQWKYQLRRQINQIGFHEDFKLIKEIGQGAFAKVYLGISQEDNQLYAIKAISKQLINSQDKGYESIRNEIKIMRQFDHRNLLKIHQVYETEHSFYLVLDILQGGSLSSYIALQYQFKPEQIKIIIKNIIQGVKYLHKKNIMHRDIKPDNILFREKGNFNSLVIADFGLSTFQDQESHIFIRCGTPGYVAPEIISMDPSQNRINYNKLCDMFSIGVILHILCTGQQPFLGANNKETLWKNMTATVNYNDPKLKYVQPDLKDLLRRLLMKNPFHRINSSMALQHYYFYGLQQQQEEIVQNEKQIHNNSQQKEKQQLQKHKQQNQQQENKNFQFSMVGDKQNQNGDTQSSSTQNNYTPKQQSQISDEENYDIKDIDQEQQKSLEQNYQEYNQLITPRQNMKSVRDQYSQQQTKQQKSEVFQQIEQFEDMVNKSNDQNNCEQSDDEDDSLNQKVTILYSKENSQILDKFKMLESPLLKGFIDSPRQKKIYDYLDSPMLQKKQLTLYTGKRIQQSEIISKYAKPINIQNQYNSQQQPSPFKRQNQNTLQQAIQETLIDSIEHTRNVDTPLNNNNQSIKQLKQ